MRVQIVASLALATLAAADYCGTGNGITTKASLAVSTTSGIYTGFTNSSTPDVNTWLGIPFGTPPLGDLRFMPSLPAPKYDARAATSYGNLCIQNSQTNSGVFWLLVPQFQNTDPQSEDCLYLNIWAPAKPAAMKKKVPVLIWVVGGSLMEGGGHAPYQVPDHWIQRTQTHIVVTFNYRVNLFGFPAAAGAFGNPGLTDIRLVVEWVRDNIAGFGGDVDNMVLWGQSAGGFSVIQYTYANAEDPIVSGFIADSGVAPQGPGTNTTDFSIVAANLGCGNLTAKAELECMQKVDAFAIQKFLEANPTGPPGSGPQGQWAGYVTDNVTVYSNNTYELEKGHIAKRPIIMGSNKNEGAPFLPFSLNETAPDYTEAQVQAVDKGFVCPVEAEADARAAHNLTVYRYLFEGNFTNITPRYWLGAMHSSELPLIFGTHYLFRGNSTELEWLTSYAMEAFWTSFAANTSAAPVDNNNLTWPRYEGDNSSIIVFANQSNQVPAKVQPWSVMNQIFPFDTC